MQFLNKVYNYTLDLNPFSCILGLRTNKEAKVSGNNSHSGNAIDGKVGYFPNGRK